MRLTSSIFVAAFVFFAGLFVPAQQSDAHPRSYRHTHRRVVQVAPTNRYFVSPFDRRYFYDPVTGRYIMRNRSRSWRYDDDDDDDHRRWRRWRRWR